MSPSDAEAEADKSLFYDTYLTPLILYKVLDLRRYQSPLFRQNTLLYVRKERQKRRMLKRTRGLQINDLYGFKTSPYYIDEAGILQKIGKYLKLGLEEICIEKDDSMINEITTLAIKGEITRAGHGMCQATNDITGQVDDKNFVCENDITLFMFPLDALQFQTPASIRTDIEWNIIITLPRNVAKKTRFTQTAAVRQFTPTAVITLKKRRQNFCDDCVLRLPLQQGYNGRQIGYIKVRLEWCYHKRNGIVQEPVPPPTSVPLMNTIDNTALSIQSTPLVTFKFLYHSDQRYQVEYRSDLGCVWCGVVMPSVEALQQHLAQCHDHLRYKFNILTVNNLEVRVSVRRKSAKLLDRITNQPMYNNNNNKLNNDMNNNNNNINNNNINNINNNSSNNNINNNYINNSNDENNVVVTDCLRRFVYIRPSTIRQKYLEKQELDGNKTKAEMRRASRKRSKPSTRKREQRMRKRSCPGFFVNSDPYEKYLEILSPEIKTKHPHLLDREYFHGQTMTPFLPHEFDDPDSDCCVDEAWLQNESNRLIQEFDDVTYSEKLYMSTWNKFVSTYKQTSMSTTGKLCISFTKEKLQELKSKNLRFALLFHLMSMWESSLIDSKHVKTCMNIIDNK